MKSNILFLLHLPPPIHGSSMVGKLIKDSVNINEQFNCDYLNLLASKSVSNTGKISVNKIVGFIKVWSELFFKLLQNKPTLCYFAITATGAAFFRDVLLIATLKLFKVKCIYHMHNKGVFKFQNNKIYNFCYAFVFKKAEVILLSKYLYEDIKKYVPKSSVQICPNGIPDVDYNKNSTNSIKDNGVKILFLSNLIASKGVFVLVEACKILKEKGIVFKCDFIGGEGDISEIQFNEKVKELNLIDQVNYLGKKFGTEKNAYFSKANIFVFPTYYSNECFPLVLLEALQAKLPIISTFEGGIPDIVEDGVTGFLVPQKDVLSLAEKLELLLKNEALRNEMKVNGRNKFENFFTLEKFEKKMCNILINTIEKNK